MPKLDKQNRMVLPKRLMEISETNFAKNVMIFLREDTLFLDNICLNSCIYHNLGVIRLDSHNRFYVPKLAREFLNILPGDTVTCFVTNGQITLSKHPIV